MLLCVQQKGFLLGLLTINAAMVLQSYPSKNVTSFHFGFEVKTGQFCLKQSDVPASSLLSLDISLPRASAASRCLSGQAGAVHSNTAGAVMTTLSPCGIRGLSVLYPLAW